MGKTGGKISGGSVTLKVWEPVSRDEVNSYNGNDTANFDVGVFNKALITGEGNRPVAGGRMTVTFKNGVAKGKIAFYDYSDDDDDDWYDDDWDDDDD